MGNNAIIIRTVGSHHNGNAGHDAEQIAKRCVDELRAARHTILSASAERAAQTANAQTANAQTANT